MSVFKDQLSEPLTYPDAPGFKEKGGALEDAAKRLAPALKKNQTEALNAFHRAGKPLTADELADFLGKTIVSIRPRVSELRRLGLIVPSGERRASSFGQASTVWKLRPTDPAELEPIAIPRIETAPSIEGPTPIWHWEGRTFSVSREQYDAWFFAFPRIDLAAELQTIDDSQAIDGDPQRVSELLSNANDSPRSNQRGRPS